MTRILLALLGVLAVAPLAQAASCRDTVHALNQQLRPHIDEAELSNALLTRLPAGSAATTCGTHPR